MPDPNQIRNLATSFSSPSPSTTAGTLASPGASVPPASKKPTNINEHMARNIYNRLRAQARSTGRPITASDIDREINKINPQNRAAVYRALEQLLLEQP